MCAVISFLNLKIYCAYLSISFAIPYSLYTIPYAFMTVFLFDNANRHFAILTIC
jgi:hypothetical protein